MASWTKRPFKYSLIGLEQGSAAKPYEIVRTKDLRTGQEWVSCNCPSYIRGRRNKGLQPWVRSCKHTQRGYTVNSPEIDFPGKEYTDLEGAPLFTVAIPPELKSMRLLEGTELS